MAYATKNKIKTGTATQLLLHDDLETNMQKKPRA